MRRPLRNLAACVCALMGLTTALPLPAVSVYTWIDAQGVRHFSQYPPADPQQPSETLSLEPTPVSSEPDDRLQTIRDVTEDLESARLQREEQRARTAPPYYPEPPPAAPLDEPPYFVVPYPYGGPYPPAHPYPPHPGPHPPGPHRPGRPDRPEEPDEPPPASRER